MMKNRNMQPPERQPIGFWTVRAGEAVRARTRGALLDIGMTQPEWWLLHQLSLNSVGVDRTETIEKIGHNDTPQAIIDAIESAAARGWIREVGPQLVFTDSGVEQFGIAADIQRMLQEERMQGIDEVDFATAIRVLQRTIVNVGGAAWHW